MSVEGTRTPGRALVVGLGLIGSSVASGLRKSGWEVDGADTDHETVELAERLGLIDRQYRAATGDRYDLAVVATPVNDLIGCVEDALAHADLVTDVGSVKSRVVTAVTDPRFVGGHPMAGSEKSGPEAADPDLFIGATWVLTPSSTTSPVAYEAVRNIVVLLGANVVTIDAAEHDTITASISHVPHLTASALMSAAGELTNMHSSLPRLAARGFRDMTRIAAGSPQLWSNIALANSGAIARELTRVIENLEQIRAAIETRDVDRLEGLLGSAADARRAFPVGANKPDRLSMLLVTIPDRPGGLRTVVDALGENAINIEDFSVTHDEFAPQGRLEVSVATEVANVAADALRASGMQVVIEEL